MNGENCVMFGMWIGCFYCDQSGGDGVYFFVNLIFENGCIVGIVLELNMFVDL